MNPLEIDQKSPDISQEIEFSVNKYMADETFTDIKDSSKERILSAMRAHAMPEELIKEEVEFKNFFEREFFKLDEQGVQKFNMLIRLAKDSFWGAFNGSSRRFKCAKTVEDTLKKGFSSFKDVHNFFKIVSVTDKSSFEKFLNADIRSGSDKGHNRHSACKILKRTLALHVIEEPLLALKSNVLQMFEPGGFLSGIRPVPKEFLNMVKTLPNTLEEYLKIGNKTQILNKEQSTLSFNGLPIQGINTIVFNLKNIEVAIEKLERNPMFGKVDSNDLVRMKFIFEDQVKFKDTKENLLNFLYHFHEYSDVWNKLPQNKNKRNSSIETRNKNFFEEDELSILKETFPDHKIKGHKNPNSSDLYQAVNNKITFSDDFAFEIQTVTEKGNSINESPKLPTGHFVMEGKRYPDRVSNFESKMTKDETILVLGLFLEKYKDEKLPDILQFLDFYKPFNGKSSDREYTGHIIPEVKKIVDGYHEIEKKVATNGRGALFPERIVGTFESDDEIDVSKMNSKISIKRNGFEMEFQNASKKKRPEILFEYLRLSGKLVGVSHNYPKDLSIPMTPKYFISHSLRNIGIELDELLRTYKFLNKFNKLSTITFCSFDEMRQIVFDKKIPEKFDEKQKQLMIKFLASENIVSRKTNS